MREYPFGNEDPPRGQTGVGHYGVFNGSRFRSQITPRIVEFHARIDALGGKPNGSAKGKSKAQH